MTKKRLLDNEIAKALDSIQIFLEEEHQDIDNLSIVKYLASLLYLLKTNALCIKEDSVIKYDVALLYLHKEYLKNIDSKLLKYWNVSGNENIYLYSTLSPDNRLYEAVNSNGIRLDISGNCSITVLDTLKPIILGDATPEQYICALDEFVCEPLRGSALALPKEFSEIISRMLNIEGKSILNPFSGLMSHASEIKGYSYYTGIDIDRNLCDYVKLRLALLDNLSDNVNVKCDNVANRIDGKYDVVIANPHSGFLAHSFVKGVSYDKTFEKVLLQKFVDCTKEDGQMIYFAKQSTLTSKLYEAFRENIIKNNYLDALIKLPNNILPTSSMSFTVVLLKKNRRPEEQIKLIDASQMFKGGNQRILDVDEVMRAYIGEQDKCMKVSVDEIAGLHWSWDMQFMKSIADYKTREGYQQYNLSDLLTEVKGDTTFDETKGRLLHASTYPADWTDYVLSLKNIKLSERLDNTRKITCPVILFQMIKGKLCLANCNASLEEPLFIPKIVLACKLTNPNIHLGYLCMELSKKYIPVIGEGIEVINPLLFFLLKVDFPSYQEQVNLFEEAKRTALIAKAREMGLEGVIEKMKEDYINEVRMRKHDMMGHLQQLSSARKNLDYYLTHKQEFTEDDFMAGMRHEVFNQKEAIESLTLMLEIFSRESQFGTPEKINIDDFLSNNYSDGDNYTVDNETYYDVFADCGFEIEEELLHPTYVEGMTVKDMMGSSPDYAKSLNVFMAKDDLKRLFDNIIGNAVKHGFTNPENDYYIRTTLTFDRERKMYRIDVFNNGTPMPEKMDKTRYGLRGEKGGVTAGTGEGGYIVKSIVEHYGGDYDIDSSKKGTTVTVYLPYYIDDEN